MSTKKRSPEAQARRRQKFEEHRLIQRIVLDYEYHDPLNGEVVYTPEHTDKCVKTKLKLVLGYIPQHAINRERYGEVLNRFPLRPWNSKSYMWRGTFQK